MNGLGSVPLLLGVEKSCCILDVIPRKYGVIFGFLSFWFSFKGNANVAAECSGGEAGSRAAAEGASPGTESCRNSSPEPEEPGEERAHTALESSEAAALSLPLAGREMRRVELLSAGLVLPGAFRSNPALAQPPQALPSTLLQRH